MATLIHLCCQWAGLPIVVEALLEHGANKNAKVSQKLLKELLFWLKRSGRSGRSGMPGRFWVVAWGSVGREHDLATPLHLGCQWAGLPIIVEALLEH